MVGDWSCCDGKVDGLPADGIRSFEVTGDVVAVARVRERSGETLEVVAPLRVTGISTKTTVGLNGGDGVKGGKGDNGDAGGVAYRDAEAGVEGLERFSSPRFGREFSDPMKELSESRRLRTRSTSTDSTGRCVVDGCGASSFPEDRMRLAQPGPSRLSSANANHGFSKSW